MPAHDWKRVDDGTFHDFHVSWIAGLKARLNNGLLPSKYYALAEARAAESEPDVLTLKLRSAEPPDEKPAEMGRSDEVEGAVALADAPPRVSIVTDLDTDHYIRKRRTIVIRHVTDHEIIALIEVVSPGNKSSQHAFDQFVNKVFSALDQGINVLLLDLHWPTARDPQGLHAVIAEGYGRSVTGLDPARPFTLASYLAREDRTGFVEPLAPGDELKTMPLFLENAYYINIPLEESYMAAWQTLPRHLREVLSHQD
jgi:hypothetical protein